MAKSEAAPTNDKVGNATTGTGATQANQGETKSTEQLQAEADAKVKADAEAKEKEQADLKAKQDAEAKEKANQDSATLNGKQEFKDLVKEAVNEALAPKQTSLGNSPTAQPEKRNPDVIYAKRGESEKNQFSKREWDLLGSDKAGWVEDVEVPTEVAELQNKTA